MQQGIGMIKAICKFQKKRAKVEEIYAKSLQKLVQQISTEIQEPGKYVFYLIYLNYLNYLFVCLFTTLLIDVITRYIL